MISAQKMQESHIFFVSLHPNLGNLNKYVRLPQAFRKDFAPKFMAGRVNSAFHFDYNELRLKRFEDI